MDPIKKSLKKIQTSSARLGRTGLENRVRLDQIGLVSASAIRASSSRRIQIGSLCSPARLVRLFDKIRILISFFIKIYLNMLEKLLENHRSCLQISLSSLHADIGLKDTFGCRRRSGVARFILIWFVAHLLLLYYIFIFALPN